MLPVILGVAALGTIGYGIKKCLSDESCVDSTKDIIQEGAMKAFERIEAIEEKFGLNEAMIKIEKKEEQQKERNYKNSYDNNTKKIEAFTELYQSKLSILKELQEKYNLSPCKPEDIKKDNVVDIIITAQMMTNLASYNYILKNLKESISKIVEIKPSIDLDPYVSILSVILTTKIVKKGALNEESHTIIQNALALLMQERESIIVKLDD